MACSPPLPHHRRNARKKNPLFWGEHRQCATAPSRSRAAEKARKAGKRLKQIVKGLAAFRRTLSSKAAEKQVDPTVRALFMAEAEPIGADAQSLRDALACPGDQAARPFPSGVD